MCREHLTASIAKVATLVIDTTGPVNTIGQQFVTDLKKASARAVRDEVRGIPGDHGL